MRLLTSAIAAALILPVAAQVAGGKLTITIAPASLTVLGLE